MSKWILLNDNINEAPSAELRETLPRPSLKCSLLSQSSSNLWQLASSHTPAQVVWSLNAALCSLMWLLVQSHHSLQSPGCILPVFSAFSWCWPLIFVSCPFHLLTHLFFVTFICLSVCWPGCYALCLCCGSFHLQYPRCVCTFPRRRSCRRGCGPRCWCIWWIWWVTKQLFCVCVCVCEGCVCFSHNNAASASIGDSRTNVPPGPTVSPQNPALTPQSWTLASLISTTLLPLIFTKWIL